MLVGQVAQDLFKLAGGLARTDHVDVERAEDILVLGQGVRQPDAAFDLFRDVEQDLAELGVLGLARRDLEGADERQVGADHHRQLAREDHQVLGLDALEEGDLEAERARADVLLDRRDAQVAVAKQVEGLGLGLRLDRALRGQAGRSERLVIEDGHRFLMRG